MITQTIKRWFRNMFAWWPWKHTPPVEYKQASGPLGVNIAQEGISLSAVEGTTPQTSITPRLSTIEERPERTISAHSPATNDKTETSQPSLKSPLDNAPDSGRGDTFSAAPSTPTPQQRLEFMRYLVQRGIVNDGPDN